VAESSIQSIPANLTISTGTRITAKFQVPERPSGPFRQCMDDSSPDDSSHYRNKNGISLFIRSWIYEIILG